MSFLDELELLVRARYALIVLDTFEEGRAEEALRHVASRLSLHFFAWSRTKGVRRGASSGDPLIDATAEPAKALAHVEREGTGVYHFPGLGAYLEDPLVAGHVKDAVARFATTRGALVITGHDVRLPDALRPHATVLRLPGPSMEEYRALLDRLTRDFAARMPLKIELSPADRTRLLKNLTGLTLVEAEKILTRLIIEDGCLRSDDIARVVTAKRKVIEQHGLLEYHPAEHAMSDVAGLAGLKSWLAKRRASITDPARASDFGLTFPKGVLLLGVPGCGKSLSAKAVAREWGLPLLKLDPANLYDKFVGDSEKNFKRAMLAAERMAPVVLWIDELEKVFASSGGAEDGGVSRRVLGSFLSWLQDRKGDVFVVATSNDVTTLPPEFIRKGRFDEVFFVDLPGAAARRAIFEIHLAKRKQRPDRFGLDALVEAAEGFSGAEIEQAIVSGLYTAFACNAPLSSDVLLAELAATRPLSRTMAERLDGLRDWARDRTVSAD